MIQNNAEFYTVEYAADFEKSLKRFVTKKKFRKLPQQIGNLLAELKEGNFSGTLLFSTDKPARYDIYKKRLPNEDMKEGKSNGYRVIYLTEHDNKIIVLLVIYYKKEQDAISDAYIAGLIDGFFASGK